MSSSYVLALCPVVLCPVLAHFRGACLRAADSPVHVTALALELAQPVDALQAHADHGYAAHYVTSSEANNK